MTVFRHMLALLLVTAGCASEPSQSGPLEASDVAADTEGEDSEADVEVGDVIAQDSGETDVDVPDPEDPECEGPSALVGGVFTDSDGTAARIDDAVQWDGAPSAPDGGFTQADYRAMLGEPIPLQGNLHSFAYEHILPDLEAHQWPETAHYLLRYIQANGRVSWLVGYDGVSGEGMNYHFLWLAGLERLAAVLDGYQDPPDWTPPLGVRHLSVPLTHDQVIPPSERWDTMVTGAVQLTLPDGTDSGSHDTGLQYHDGSEPDQASCWGAGGFHCGFSIDAAARSYLLPAYGQLGLGGGSRGEAALQTQSILHFSPKVSSNGHAHNDTLMFGLFGRGRNLLSFPGHQDQSHGPLNKNMVVIDDRWQNKFVSDIAGRLEVFASMPGVQLARVDASHIMHGGNANGTGGLWVDRYRRTLIQNTVDAEHPYVLDLFEVDGGGAHHYLLRGSEVLDQRLPSTSLTTSAGTMPIPDSREAVFEQTQTATVSAGEAFWVDFVFEDAPGLGTRTHFAAQPDEATLYLNRLVQPWTRDGSPGAAQLTLRREGAQPLQTVFVALHEVLDGTGGSVVSSVTTTELGEDAMAVVVTLHSGRIDTYLVSYAEAQPMSHGELEADALLAAQVVDGDRADLWMVGGRTVRNADTTLLPVGEDTTGAVLQIRRREDGAQANAFDTDMVLPMGHTLAGQTLLLEHFEGEELVFVNSYTIDRVEDVCDRTRVHVRVDPGVRATEDGYEEAHHPWRESRRARLRFVASGTTVPRVVHVTPGVDPAQRLAVYPWLSVAPGESVQITTVPADTPVEHVVDGEHRGEVRDGEVSITEPTELAFWATHPEGVVSQEPWGHAYLTTLPALDVVPGPPGLRARRWSGYTYNFDLDDPENSYDFGRFDEEVVSGLSFDQVPYAQVGAGSGVIVDGYLDVPVTGHYRFHTRMDRAVRLSIDGHPVIDERGMRRAPQWTADVYLEAGLHAIEVFHYSQVNAHFAVNWEGPSMSYGTIPSDRFYQPVSP